MSLQKAVTMTDLITLVKSEVDRAMQQLIVRTTIADVDHEKQLIKVKVGDGESGWVEVSGSKSSWTAPEVDQPVIMLNPCGDLDQGIAINGGYSEAHPSPSTEGGAFVEKRGSSIITIKDGEVTIKSDTINVIAPEITLKGTNVTVDASLAVIKGIVKLGGANASVGVMGSIKVFTVLA